MLTWILSGAYLYAMCKITKGLLEDTKEQRELYKLQKQQEADVEWQSAKASWKARPWYEKTFIFTLFLIGILLFGVAIWIGSI